jgi:hypothetical protein
MDVKEIREALEKIEKAQDEVSVLCKGKRWLMSIPANRRTDSDLIIGDALLAAREALSLLDAPVASDAREFVEATDGKTYEVLPDDRTLASLLHEMWEDYTDDIEENSVRIAIYRAARERKAREETARKCAEAFRSWMLRGQAGGANRLEAAIMEAAHE